MEEEWIEGICKCAANHRPIIEQSVVDQNQSLNVSFAMQAHLLVQAGRRYHRERPFGAFLQNTPFPPSCVSAPPPRILSDGDTDETSCARFRGDSCADGKWGRITGPGGALPCQGEHLGHPPYPQDGQQPVRTAASPEGPDSIAGFPRPPPLSLLCSALCWLPFDVCSPTPHLAENLSASVASDSELISCRGESATQLR